MATPKKSALKPTAAAKRQKRPSAPPPLPSLSVEDQPILLRNDHGSVIAGIKLESLTSDNSMLRLTGWSFGSPRLALFCDGKRLTIQTTRIPRLDVFQSLSAICEFDPGFEIIATVPQQGTFVLRWQFNINNKHETADFWLNVNLPSNESGIDLQAIDAWLTPPRPKQISEKSGFTSHFDCALPLGNGIIILGWLEEAKFGSSRIFIHRNKNNTESFVLSDNASCRASQFYRVDLAARLKIPVGQFPLNGFVAWLPLNTEGLNEINIGFTNKSSRAQTLALTKCNDDNPDFENLLEYCGYRIAQLADELRDESWLLWCEERGYTLQDPTEPKIAAIDHAYIISGRALLIHGWIAAVPLDIKLLTLRSDQHTINLAARVKRIYRPDLFGAYPHMSEHLLGFIALVDEAEFITLTRLDLILRTDYKRVVVSCTPKPIDLSSLCNMLNSTPALVEPVSTLARSTPAIYTLPGFEHRFRQFLITNSRSRMSSLLSTVNDPKLMFAAIDRVFNLEDGGLLIFGWYFSPVRKILSITLQCQDELAVDLNDSLFPLIRQDVSSALSSKFPGITDYCGFCCHVPVATRLADLKALRFSLEGNLEVWLRVDNSKIEASYMELIQEIFNHLPNPAHLSNNLFALYDKVIGIPLKNIIRRTRQTAKSCASLTIGVQPIEAAVSLIMTCSDPTQLRQFLCHAAEDRDIGTAEIICVVTKTAQTNEFLEVANYCSDLFSLPVVLALSQENLDTAEAHNIGARLANASLLVFIEEGVIPCNNRMLHTLKAGFTRSPTPTAICPLALLFDGSTHNYGRQVVASKELPGFLFSRPNHAKPREAVTTVATFSLSRACIAIQKTEFIEAGGLNTSYIHADFAWDEFSATLAARGKAMVIDLESNVWQRSRPPTPKTGIQTIRDFIYFFDAWSYTNALSQSTNRKSSN